MLMVRTKIAKSRINGIGLFADQPISKGTRIWQYHDGFDRSYDRHGLDGLPQFVCDRLLHYCYVSKFSGRIIVPLDDARFINHDDNPNTMDDPDVQEASVASRDIREGEELTEDYWLSCGDAARRLTRP